MDARLPTPEREAAITMHQLPNGYWHGLVTIRVPQLPDPFVQTGDAFHTAEEVIVWARGVIDLFTRDV